MKPTYKQIKKFKIELSKQIFMTNFVTKIVNINNDKTMSKWFHFHKKQKRGFHTNALCVYYKTPSEILINADFKVSGKKRLEYLKYVLYHEIGHLYYCHALGYSPQKMRTLLKAMAKFTSETNLSRRKFKAYDDYEMNNWELFANAFAHYFIKTNNRFIKIRPLFYDVCKPFFKNVPSVNPQYSTIDLQFFTEFRDLHPSERQNVSRPITSRRSKKNSLEFS